MLAVQDLCVEYGARTLFRDLSFVIMPGERIALAGHNGAGKSTLMKCIAGLIEPSHGKIARARDCRVGYLPQEGIHIKGRTLLREVESAFGDVLSLQREIQELGAQLQKEDPRSSPYAQLLEQIGELELRLEEHDVARMKPRIESILRGLGFASTDFGRDCGEFSGGWQMRIALAKLLLQEPEVLLLDEPTNHLDLDSQRWMENYLQTYRGAIVLISHDLALLDSLVKRTIAFHHGRAEEYSGNYSFFLRESAIRRDVLRRQAKAQQKEIAKTKEFIDRFRAKATKASLVQSRIKQLEKVEIIELEDDDAVMSFRFPPPPLSGHLVARLENAGKHYGELRIFENFDFEITKGDRIAIVGVNGAGKSTFCRLVSGQEQVDTGICQLGQNTRLAFFSQNHADELDPEKTVLETVSEAASREVLPNVRNLLGCFLFRGDDVFKQVGVLSGGERSRVALVRMLVQPANFLILDEPTNHLDMQSQEVLQQALRDYPGSYCIVSHNRAFLDPVVDKVLEFRRGESPRVFLGNVSAYVEKIEEERRGAQAFGQGSGAASAPGVPANPANRKEQRRLEAEIRQKRARVLKPLQDELASIEAQIAELETRMADLGEQMNDPEVAADADRLREVSLGYSELERQLERYFSKWEELSGQIEALDRELAL